MSISLKKLKSVQFVVQQIKLIPFWYLWRLLRNTEHLFFHDSNSNLNTIWIISSDNLIIAILYNTFRFLIFLLNNFCIFETKKDSKKLLVQQKKLFFCLVGRGGGGGGLWGSKHQEIMDFIIFSYLFFYFLNNPIFF